MFFNQPKETILAIHGSASTAKQWASLGSLVQADYNFVAPTVPDSDAQIRLEAILREVRHCHTGVHLVAHSFGSAIALKVANLVPEKILGISLYDAVVPVRRDADMGPPPDLVSLAHRVKLLGPERGSATFINYWAGDDIWDCLHPRKQEALAQRYPSILRDFDQIIEGSWTPSRIRYQGPLSLVRGAKSPNSIAKTHCYLSERYQNVTQSVLVDGTHLTPLSDPNKTDEALIECVWKYNQTGNGQMIA